MGNEPLYNKNDSSGEKDNGDDDNGDDNSNDDDG